ncbi:MAG: hypothetical protein IJ735_07370 [Clostridia bacterium]|nr:hypothetical protein [Clostridia bacterium]
MLNKNTILFFTESFRTDFSEAVREELSSDPSVVSVIIERREIRSATIGEIVDKIFPEDGKVRRFLYNAREEKATILRTEKKDKKPVVYDNKNHFQRRVLNVLNRYNPSVVVITAHTIIDDVIAATEHYGKGVKIAVFAEDYVLDRRLVHPAVDKYFVDNFSMRNELVEIGVAPDKVEISDLPAKKIFFLPGDATEARKKLALDPKDTVLVAASREGDERFVKVVKAIVESDLDVNVAVACGKNATFYNEVRSLGANAYNEAVNMNAALDACDVVVARPTNVLIAEALAKKKKVICLYPATRAEEENLKYLSLSTVLEAKDEDEVVRKIQAYFADEEEEEVTEEPDRYSARNIARKLTTMGSTGAPSPAVAPSVEPIEETPPARPIGE